MTDRIDLEFTAEGDDGVNRLTSAIVRLTAAMEDMGSSSAAANLAKQMEQMQGAMNTALGALTMQMQEMKQVLATGFADISATNQKLIEAMGDSQARGLHEAGDKAADAVKEGNAKISAAMRADANTLLQASRGMSSNVEQAFTLMFAGAPPEAVRERFGAIATEAAQGMKTLEDLMQFRANAKSVAQIDYKPMAGATEAQMQEAAALNARFDAERLSAQERLGEAMAAATVAELERIDTIQLKRREALEQAIADQYKLGETMAAATVAELERIDTIQMKRSEEAAQARTAQERLGEAMAAATVAELERIDTIQMKRREAAQQAIEDEYRRGEAMAAATVADLERIDTIKLRRHDAAMQAVADEKLKNASYMTASPTSQLNTQIRAVGLREEGLNPAQFVGPKAAADAAGKSVAGLRAELEALKAAQAEAGAVSYGLTGALRQAESAFKGAAHEAGVYGLAHGQLIALLAGGAVAAALHHIAETGAEVQFQLASLNAFSGSMTPIDVDKFIGITAGSMTSLKDAAEGMHALAQAGMDQQQAFSALPNVMRLASLGEMSVGQAAETAIESMHAFGKEVNDIGQIGDILVAVGSKSNVSVGKLAADMKSAATMGELLGMSMEETAAAVGVLAERGLTIQPLSSAMLKLYEPSDKVAKVIKQLHLEVKDASTGAFRPFSDILTDLSGKLMKFSPAGVTDTLKAMGFSSRDIKAMEAMTQHLDDYQHLLHEAENAQGKMFDAMLVKEDTVKGAWERLGSTLDGTLVKGFQNASPVIQQVENDLMHMASSSNVVTLVTDLAAGFARLTRVLVENAGVIASVVAGYVALKAVSSLTTLTVEFTAAELAATRALEVNRTATGAAGAQLTLFAAEEEAAAVGTEVLETRLIAGAAGARLFAASFGWIAIAATAAIAAYELLSGKVSEVDGKYQTVINTSNTTVDAYDREIDRLKQMNYQLEHVGTNAEEAGGKLATIGLNSQKFQLQLALDDFDNKMAAYKRGDKGSSNPMGWSWENPRDKIVAQLGQVDEALDNIRHKQEAVTSERSKNSLLEDSKKITDALLHIPLADEMTSKLGIKDSAVIQALQARRKEIQFTTVDEENHAEVLEKVKQLQLDIGAAKQGGIGKPALGDKDAARVAIELLQEKLRLEKMDAKSDIDDLKSANKRGELGDLQLINAELQRKRDLNLEALQLAIAEKAAAGPLSAPQRQKYDNAIKTASKQFTVDETSTIRAKQDYFDKIDGLELQHRATVLTEQGRLQEAFNLNWEAKYRNTLDNLDNDIASTDDDQIRTRLLKYKAFYQQLHDEGEAAAIFKMDENDFNSDLAKVKAKMAELKTHAGSLGGLSSVVGELVNPNSAANSGLAGLREDQAVMKADAGSDPVKQRAAQNALKEIHDQSMAFKATWVDIGSTIAKALTDAYGKGGAALGSMITAATTYAETTRNIQDELDKSDGGTEARNKAAAETSAAQVKSYGDMAGAAKGFFDVNSKGYKALHAAEQAFRAFELVSAIGNAATKLMLEGSVTAAVIGGEAAKSAAVVEGVGVQLAADTVKGTSAAAVAVATQAQGDPYSAWVRMAAMAAAMAALGFAVAGSRGTDTTAKDRQAANGTGTILGDPTAKTDSIAKALSLIESNTYGGLTVSQDMLTALQSIAGNITSFAGQLVQSGNINNPNAGQGLNTNNGGATTLLGLGAFGVLTPLLMKIPVIGNFIGKVATAIFGGKQTLSDDGFTMGATTLGQVASQGANAKTYQDVLTSGGWFSSDHRDTQTASVGADANQAISQIITGIGGTIKSAASILGLSGSEFDQKLNGFVIDIGKISLKGLSSADQQTAINNAFSKLGDQMATSAVATIEQFSQAGEGALQTLVRVAAEVQSVQVVFASFGAAFTQTGVEAASAADAFIMAAGGLSKFTSQADYFFKNFLTQGQQTAATLARISPTLQQYGLSTVGANANQQFAQLVTTFAEMGSAGATAYTALMNIAPAFKSITDVAQGLRDQLNQTLSQTQQDAITRADLDPANQDLFDQVQQAKLVAKAKSDLVSAYQSEVQSMQSAIDRLKSFSVSLHAFVNSLQLGNLSPLTPMDKYGAAMAQFNDTLTKAKSGDVTAQGNLQSAAQAFLQASRDANASNSTYQADYDRVVASTNGMANWADQQVTDGQANLIVLHDQVNKLVDIRTATLSVVEAINNLALVSSGGKDTSVNKTIIDSLYKELLGRDTPDAAGESFWIQQLKNGVPLSAIIDGFKNSTEYTTHTNAQPVTQTVTPSTQYGTANQPTTPVVTAPSPTLQIDTLYEQLFGHAADQAGEAFWVSQLNNGVSLSAISDAMKQSTEYQDMHATQQMPSTVVAPPPPMLENPVVESSGGSNTNDVYTTVVASNAQVVEHLAVMNQQLADMRSDQQVQADQQVDATMNAGAGTADQVASAITESAQASAWVANNKVSLR